MIKQFLQVRFIYLKETEKEGKASGRKRDCQSERDREGEKSLSANSFSKYSQKWSSQSQKPGTASDAGVDPRAWAVIHGLS